MPRIDRYFFARIEKINIFAARSTKPLTRRGGRVVECGGLENR